MTVGELERRMTVAEFKEWIAFFLVEPMWNPHTGTALICRTIMAAHGVTTDTEDYLPYDVEPEYMTAEESAEAFAKMFPGRINET